MDPDGPISRVERTFWTVWTYITGAVTRLFRPESANPVQENRVGSDLGQTEDDSHGGGVTEEQCKLTTTSVVGSSQPSVTWEGCNTDMDLQPDEMKEEPSNQSENEDMAAKKNEPNEGSMKDSAEAMIPQEIDEAINAFQVKKEDDSKQSENEPQDFKVPHPLWRLEDEDHIVKPCTTTDLYGEEEDNVHKEDAAATGGTHVAENIDDMLQLTAENENSFSFNMGLEPDARNLFSVSEDKRDFADLMSSENLLHDESPASSNKNTIVLSDELVGLGQESVMADGSDKSDKYEEMEGESTVIDGEECPTTRKENVEEAETAEKGPDEVPHEEDHDAPEHITCRETELLDVAKDAALETKTKADQTEHRIAIKEQSDVPIPDISSERLVETDLDPLNKSTFSSEDNKESDVKNALTTSTVTETPEGSSAKEGKNVPLQICEGQTVVHQELNSAACEETPEGLPEYNNKPGLSENTAQWYLEAGDYEETPTTQMPEELESKEPESVQSSSETDDLLRRNHTEEEHNAECSGAVQLQDMNEETLVAFEINGGLRESTGDDAAQTVDEGHGNTRTEAAAGFCDETMKYTLDKVIQDVMESGFLLQSESKMYEDRARGLQSVATETQEAMIDVAEIDDGIEEDSENKTKMEILEIPEVAAEENPTAEAPVPSLETETQQSNERAESWDEEIPSDTVAADEMITGQSGSNDPSFILKDITQYVWESEGAHAEEAQSSNVGNENVIDDKILDLWLETTLSEDTDGKKPELLEWSEPEQQSEGQDETSSAETEEKDQLVKSESSGESGLASDTESSTELGCLEDSSSDWYAPNYDTQLPKSAGNEVFQGTCVMSGSADVSELSTNQSELQDVLIKDVAEEVQLNIKGTKSGWMQNDTLEEMDASNKGKDETSSLKTDEKDQLLESDSSGTSGYSKSRIVPHDELVDLGQDHMMADKSELLHDKPDDQEEMKNESRVSEVEEGRASQKETVKEVVETANKIVEQSDVTTADFSAEDRFTTINVDRAQNETLSSEDIKDSHPATTVTETPEGSSAKEAKNVPLQICEGQTVVHQELNSATCEETPEGLPEYNNKPGLSENTAQWYLEAGDYEETPTTQMPEELESKEPESVQSSTEAEDLLMRNHTEEENNEECGRTVQLTDSESPLEGEKLVHDTPTQGLLLYFEDVAQFPSDSMKMEVQNSEEESVDQTDKELQDRNEETLVEIEIDGGLRESTGDDAAQTVDEGHENTRTEAAAGFCDGTMKYTLDKVIKDVTKSGFLLQSETKMYEDGARGLQSAATETQEAMIDVAEIDDGTEEDSENKTKMEILEKPEVAAEENPTAEAPVPSLETETQDITQYVWESEGAHAGEAQSSNAGNENVIDDKILDLWLETTLSEDTDGKKPELLEWSEPEQQSEGQDETSSAETEEKDQAVESESSGESGLASDTETSTELGCLEDSSSDWYAPNYDTQFPKSAGNELFQGTCVMSGSADVSELSTNQSELQDVLIKDAAEEVQLNTKGTKSVNEAGFHFDLGINLSGDKVPNQLHEEKAQAQVSVDVEVRTEQLEWSEPAQQTDEETDASNERKDETSSLKTDEKDQLLESDSSGTSWYSKSRIVPHDELVDLGQDHMLADISEVLHDKPDDQEEMKNESRVSEVEEGPASQKETVKEVVETANKIVEQSDVTTADFSAEDRFTTINVDRAQNETLSSEDIKDSHPATTVTETPEGSSAKEAKNVPLQICEGQTVVHQELNSAACEETPEGLPEYNNKPGLSENTAQWYLEAGDYEETPTTQMPEELENKEPESVQSSTEAEDLLMRNHTEEENNAECGGTVQLPDSESPLEREKLVHDTPTQGLLLYFEDVAQFPSDSMKMEVQNSEEESVDQTDKELQDRNEETLVEIEIDGGLRESTGDDAAQTVDEGHENTRAEAAARFCDETMKYTLDKVIQDVTKSGFLLQSETKMHEDRARGLQSAATETQEVMIHVAEIDDGTEEDSKNKTKMEILEIPEVAAEENPTAEAPVPSLETETQQSNESAESWDEEIPSDTVAADEMITSQSGSNDPSFILKDITQYVWESEGAHAEEAQSSNVGNENVIDDKILDLWLETTLSEDTDGKKPEQQSEGQDETSSAETEEKDQAVESESSGESGLASDTETSTELGCLEDSSSDWYAPIYDTQFPKSAGNELFQGTCVMSGSADVSELSTNQSELQDVLIKDAAEEVQLNIKGTKGVNEAGFHFDLGINLSDDKVPNQLHEEKAQAQVSVDVEVRTEQLEWSEPAQQTDEEMDASNEGKDETSSLKTDEKLNSAACEETPEGFPEYNNNPGLSENTAQWYLETGDYEETPTTQMPEELESKEPESVQSSTEAEDLLMRNHTEEENNAECGGTVQLTDSESPLEGEKLVHDTPTQGLLFYFEDVAQFPSDSMKMEVQNSEEESVDQTDKELQDRNEETLVEIGIDGGLQESTGDDAAQTVDEGHENTRTEAAAGFCDETMKYTLDKVIQDVTESGFLLQSETKMYEDGARGLQSAATETQEAMMDLAGIDGGTEEDSKNKTKMEILEMPQVAAEENPTAEAPVPSLETETQQSSKRAESWDEEIPSESVAADEALSEDADGVKPELLEWSEHEQQSDGQDETSPAKTEQVVDSDSSGESGLASDTEMSDKGDEEKAEMHVTIDPEVRTEQKEADETSLKVEQTQPQDDPSIETERSDFDQIHETEKNVQMLIGVSGSDFLFEEQPARVGSLKTFPAVDESKPEWSEEKQWMIKPDKDEVDAPALDFAAQRSKIAVKNPHVRPPRNPRALLQMPSACPTPSRPPAAKVLVGVPMGGLGIGIKLPGLGEGFPVLKKTQKRVRDENLDDSPQESETKPEEKSDAPQEDEAPPKPKWMPPRHPGFGNPLLSELKTKLKKTTKE